MKKIIIKKEESSLQCLYENSPISEKNVQYQIYYILES